MQPPNQSHIYADTIEQARQRIGLGHTDQDWKLLKWYVEFVQVDLVPLSPGARQVLKEDLIALQHEISQAWSPEIGNEFPPPEDSWIASLQQDIKPFLYQLANTGETALGPFTIQYIFTRTSGIEGWKRKIGDPAYWKSSRLFGDTRAEEKTTGQIITTMTAKAFLLHLSRLLEKVQQEVKRCPRCNRLFLPIKNTARYCGRTCQSREIARQSRKSKKEKKTTRIKKHKTKKKGR